MTLPEAITVAGHTVYTRPYPTRVSIRLRENAIATGLPAPMFAALSNLSLCAISLESDLAIQVAAALIRSAGKYKGHREARALALHLANASAPRQLSDLIGFVQQTVARSYQRALFRARVLRHGVRVLLAVFAHAIVTQVLTPLLISSPYLVSLALGFSVGLLTYRFLVVTLSEPWAAAPLSWSAAATSAGASLSIPMPNALGAWLFVLGALSLFGSLFYFELQAKRRLFAPPAPPAEPLPESPHLHWPRAIAPAWFAKRQLLPDSPNFADPELLWARFGATTCEPYFFWAGLRMPLLEAYGNAALLGAPGSGKTKLIECSMRGLLPSARRALVYDPKRLFYPTLDAIFGADDVALSYPFDARACVWNVAADCDNEVRAATFARSRIPDRPDQNGPYWTQSARALLVAILIWLQLVKPSRWSLRDLGAAVEREYLIQILKATEYGRYQYEQHLKVHAARDGVRPDSVIAGLAAALEPLRPVAAAHDYHMRAGRFFSVRDWISGVGPRCIVFSRDREHGAALDPLNQTLFDYAAMMLLDHPVSKRLPDTFLYLDELQESVELSALQEILSNGRERGVSTILSAQSLTALSARYGSDRAKAIIDLCRSQAFLRLDSVETAELASKLCGSQTFVDVSESRGTNRTVTRGHTSGSHPSSNRSTAFGDSEGTSSQVRSEPLVSAGTLLELPSPSKELGLVGLFRQEAIRAFHLLSPTWIADSLPPRSSAPTYVPLDSLIASRFRGWTKPEFFSLLSRQPGARRRGLLDRLFETDDPKEDDT